MRFKPAIFAILSAVALPAMPLGAAVTVTFANPDRFTDAADRARDSRQTMLEIERHLVQLGDRYLSPQDTLRIEVLNIDLAGRTRIAPRMDPDLRVLDGKTDWPRIDVRYTLESGGKVSPPTEETISDMSYLMRIDPRYSSASLPYEKRMLEEWFRERFVERRPPRPR